MVTGVGGRRPSTKHVRATSVALACAVLCGLIAAWPGRGDTLEWEPTGGPYGGWVSSLAAGPADELYAAVGRSGLFRSTNDGDTWSRVETPSEWPTVNRVAVAGGFVLTHGEGDLHRSADLKAWRPVELPARTKDIVVLQVSDGVVWVVASLPGNDPNWLVLRSTDDGNTWRRLDPPIPGRTRPRLAVAGGRLYILASDGLYRRDQARRVWIPATRAGLSEPVSVLHGDGPTLYAGTERGGVHELRSGTTRWAAVGPGLLDSAVRHIATRGSDVYASTQAGVFRLRGDRPSQLGGGVLPAHSPTVLAATDGGLFVGAGYLGVYRSRDGAASWVEVTRGLGALHVSDLLADNSALFANSGLAVHRYDTGRGIWTAHAGASADVRFTAVGAAAAGLLAASRQGAYRSHDGGETWRSVLMRMGSDDPAGPGVAPFAELDGRLLMSGGHGMYSLSEDSGAWKQGSRMMSGGLAVSGDRIFVATATGVQASDGVGILWRVMSAGLDSQRVTCIAAVGRSLWAGTAQSSGGAAAGIYRWDDSNGSWTLTTDDVWGYGPHPGKIAALQACGGYVFASALGTVWRYGGVQPRWRKTGDGLRGLTGEAIATHDGALHAVAGGRLYRLNAATWTWEAMSTEPEGPLKGGAQALWASDEGLYVGTDSDGVYRSTDGGASWANIGLGDVRVWALCAYRGAIYAGGRYGGGVHRWRDDDHGWQPVNQGLESPPHPMRAITAMGDRLYAVVDHRLHVSRDDGTTWAPADAPSNDIVALSAANGALYAGTRGDGLHVMDAATDSWRQSAPVETDIDAAWIAVVGGTIYAGAADGGTYASSEQLSRHARDTMRVRVDDARVLLHDDAHVYVVNAQGLLRSSHGGRGGGRSPDVSHAITAAAVLDGTAYVATADRGVLRSFGSKWRPENDGLTIADVRGLARLGQALYAGVYGAGVFRGAKPAPDKEEAGLRPAERAKRVARRGRAPLSWAPVGEEAPMSQTVALAASETTLYVAVTGGDIYASTDTAASWRLATTTPDATEARGLATLEDALYVATERGIFRAQADGDWQVVPLTPPVIRSVAAREGAAFVLTIGGVYRAASPDGPWARISRHAEPLTHIELHDDALYAAQDYGVVLRADLDD